MSFNLDKNFNKILNMTGKTQSLVQAVNNLSAVDNMRLNQTRFKQAFSDAAQLKQAIRKQEVSNKRAALRNTSKQLKVRFSIDVDSEMEGTPQQQKQTNIHPIYAGSAAK